MVVGANRHVGVRRLFARRFGMGDVEERLWRKLSHCCTAADDLDMEGFIRGWLRLGGRRKKAWWELN